jgi:hypothetical protein
MQMKMVKNQGVKQKQKMSRRAILIVAATSSTILIVVALIFIFNVGNIRKTFALSKDDIEVKMIPSFTEGTNGGYVDVSLYARSLNTPYRLGTSSFVIKFNPAVLAFTSMIPNGSKFTSGKYQALMTRMYGNDAVSIETTLAGSTGDTIPATGGGSLIGILKFRVIQPGAKIEISWSDQSKYSAIYQDDERSILAAAFVNPSSFLPPQQPSLNFIDFTAELQSDSAVLKWDVDNEINISSYQIERSRDGFTFNPLITKTSLGNGTNPSQHSYQTTDTHLLEGVSYYRLAETDNNGNTQIYKTISIDNIKYPDLVINSVNPTVFSEYTTLSYSTSRTGNPRLLVTNMEGKTLIDRSIESHKGENSYKINNTYDWKPGIYIVSLLYNGLTVNTKMIKQ